MYQVINAVTGVLMAEIIRPQWVKQQKLKDFPIVAYNEEEANGINLPDPSSETGERFYGIWKQAKDEKGNFIWDEDGNPVSVWPNMNNYPQVRVVQVPDGPALSGQLNTVQRQNDTNSDKLDAQQTLQLSGLQGQADQYTVALSTQEQVTAQQQLNLTALQGIADLYATLLTMQAALTPTTTPEMEE